jgi:hypothetical protein
MSPAELMPGLLEPPPLATLSGYSSSTEASPVLVLALPFPEDVELFADADEFPLARRIPWMELSAANIKSSSSSVILSSWIPFSRCCASFERILASGICAGLPVCWNDRVRLAKGYAFG